MRSAPPTLPAGRPLLRGMARRGAALSRPMRMRGESWERVAGVAWGGNARLHHYLHGTCWPSRERVSDNSGCLEGDTLGGSKERIYLTLNPEPLYWLRLQRDGVRRPPLTLLPRRAASPAREGPAPLSREGLGDTLLARVLPRLDPGRGAGRSLGCHESNEHPHRPANSCPCPRIWRFLGLPRVERTRLSAQR